MTITVAVVGAGRMGRLHAKQLKAIPDVRIVGTADISAEAVAQFTADFGGTGWVDYRELLDRTRPDVAYFCTPAGDHLDQLTFAAERGVNVFVEKPLAPSVAAATAAADAVEQHGILCTVGYQWRYSPLTDVVSDALAGLPPTMLAGWWYWTIPPLQWIADRRTGGGQIFEQATHLIDLMRFLAGDVSTVFATYADNAIPEAELPNWDASAVTLGFANGAAGSVHSTYALFPGIPGSNGVDVAAREVLVRVNLAKATVFRRDVPPEETLAPQGWNIDQEFMRIVRRNDPAAVRATARESARSICVSLAANYSAVTGRVVDVEDFMANPPDDARIMPL